MSVIMFRTRDPWHTKHEYEAMPDSREGTYVFVGRTEKTAFRKARELARAIEEPVRLYHSYPGGGPQRSFMGKISQEGAFYDARR